VDAALTFIRRNGADRFSMRALAKELGVTPMALYYYVGNKDELLERVADAILARVPRPTPTGDNWREQLRAASLHGFMLLCEYPGLSAQIVKRPPTKQTEELAEYGIAILVKAGFDPAVAARATIVCQTLMFGMIGMQAQLERAGKAKTKRKSSARGAQPPLDPRALVEFGLDALTNGLRAWQKPDASEPRRRTRELSK